MSRTFHHGDRKIRVRGVRREQPDLRRLARALIDLAQAEAEAAAQAEHGGEKESPKGVSVSDSNTVSVTTPSNTTRVPKSKRKPEAA